MIISSCGTRLPGVINNGFDNCKVILLSPRTEARELLEKMQQDYLPGLVILDLNMPGNGWV